MFDHVSIQCEDLARSIEFYDAVLTTLGAERVMEFDDALAYGLGGAPSFWLGPLTTGGDNREIHLAFPAPTRDAVDAFVRAAAATGAEVLHEPRVWLEYHEHYYGGFVRDPDGNNVEAVCHTPPPDAG